MRKATLFCAITLLVVLIACQPTPENEVVVNKRDGVYEQKIDIAKREEKQGTGSKTEAEQAGESSEPAPTEAPAYEFESHWVDTVSLKSFDVDIDVDVEAPAIAVFPVYRVKSGLFTTNDVRFQSICKTLMGDVSAARSGGATLQDLEEQLEQLQLGEYDPETQSWHPYDQDTYEALAKDIMKEMETAPDEDDFASAFNIQADIMPLKLTYKATDGTLWELDYQENALNITRNVRCIEQPERWVVAGDAISGEPKGTTLQNVSCTEEEARQYVKDFFESADIGEMGISKMEKGRAVDMDTLEIVKEGWVVECARIGGNCAAVNYKWNVSGSHGTLRFEDESYSAGLKAESILLFVDDKGIATITWSNPLDVVRTEVESIEILPFEQIQELIKQAIFNGLSWLGNRDSGKSMGSYYHVTRVALSYCFAPVMDSSEEYYFTPTWFVFLRNNWDQASIVDFVIAINAVDGTRIDLSSVK